MNAVQKYSVREIKMEYQQVTRVFLVPRHLYEIAQLEAETWTHHGVCVMVFCDEVLMRSWISSLGERKELLAVQTVAL